MVVSLVGGIGRTFSTELGKETQSLDPSAVLPRDQGGSLGLVLLPLWDQ